ncbi:sulfatase family protein [Corynebacterium hindlerae]|uniref:sulfatase family protein n=1 Tax=Corynebacterium hindlerae TaxID=699041 RepID=UPI003AAF5CBD
MMTKSQHSLPNIVLIFADDLGQGDVSCCNPNAQWRTPNMDQLAAEGMMFSDSHATSSLCTPSRYALLTGRYNWRSRLKRSVLPGDSMALIEQGRLTLAQLLKRHGYATAVVGKWHLGLDWQLKDGGNDFAAYNIDPKDYPEPAPRCGRDGYFTEAAKYILEGTDIDYSQRITFGPNEMGFDYSFITAASLDQPPYVYIENGQPLGIPTHIGGDVFELDRRSDSAPTLIQKGPMVEGYDINRVAEEFQEKTLHVLETMLAEEHREPFFLFVPSHLVHGPLIPNKPWKGSTGMGDYADFVVQFDAYVGQIVSAIDASGKAEDTIIIVTSDNGASGIVGLERLREAGHDPSNGWRGHKSEIWEGGHREPFIVRWPSTIPAGTQSEHMVSHADVFATVADIIGAAIPDDAAEDSVSALPLWKGHDCSIRTELVTSSMGGGLSLYDGHYKLVFVSNADGQNALWEAAHGGDTIRYEPSQLFDLRKDPREQNNLFASEPQRARAMTERLKEIITRGRSTAGPARENAHLPEGFSWQQVAWAQ